MTRARVKRLSDVMMLLGSRQPPQPQRRGRWRLAGLVAGAGLGRFVDPVRGRQHRQRVAAVLRRGTRRLKRRTRAAALQTLGHAKGGLHRLLPAPPGELLDDAGLAHKVESVLFRNPHVPKGQISVNAERGAVFLRGQVESPKLIDDLVASVRKIHGVSDVVCLLHLPGTEAPHAGPGRVSPDGASK